MKPTSFRASNALPMLTLILGKSVRASGTGAKARFSRGLLAAFLACITALTIPSPHARAAPIINIALLARPTGTTQAFSSTISNPTNNTTWDYAVAITLLGPSYPIANANLNTQVAGYNASTAGTLTGDGVGSLSYALQEAAADASQVTFGYANAGNAAAYANYPFQTSGAGSVGKARPELDTPSNTYKTTDQSSGGVVYSPASPASPGFSAGTAVSYNLSGTTGGTPVPRGNGNFDMGNTEHTVAFSGRLGGTFGVAAANTPIQGLLAGNGVFTITSVGSGNTTSTVTPTWKGLMTTTVLVTIRHRDSASGQVQELLTVGSQQQATVINGVRYANGTNVADPIFSVTPLTITTVAAGPVNGQYTLTASAGASAIMKGDTTSVSALLNNTGTTGAGNAALDYTALSSSITAGGAFGSLIGGAPASSSAGLAVQTSATNSSYILSGSGYGSVTATTAVTSVANHLNNPATAPSDNSTNKTVTVNVGLMTPAAAGQGSTNTQLTTFGAALKSSSLPLNTPYGSGAQTAKFGTKTNDALGTTAELLDGQAGGNRTLRMAWRTRTTNETPGGPVVNPPGPVYGVRSDVVQLTGLDGSTSDTPSPTAHVQSDKFVLQMSVSDAAFGGSHAAMQAAIAHGFLYLGWLDDTAATTSTHGGLPLWRNAVAGDFNNFTTNPDNLTGYIGSYAQYYAATQGVGHTPKTAGTSLIDGSRIGDWGVQDLDPAGTNGLGAVVWAVLDHNSIFAAVPEPSSIVLLGFGLLGALAFVALQRRRVLRLPPPMNK